MKASFVMPAKNRASLIGDSIRSIQDQTEKDWEIIIVDDHSTDDTFEVASKIGDPRIKIFRMNGLTGAAATRDFAISKSSSDIILFADSDDINKPNRLEEVLKKFNEENCDVVYSKVEIHEIETNKRYIRPSSNFNLDLLKCYNYIAAPTVSFKKSVYDEFGGFDNNLSTSEDYDLWLRLALNGKKFCFINKSLVIMGIHLQNITKTVNFNKKKENLEIVRKKNALIAPSLKETLHFVNDEDLKKFISTKGAIRFWFS